MSKGNRIISCRTPEELCQLIEETIQRRNFWSADEPWTIARFLVLAAWEKVRKMERSRAPRGAKRRKSKNDFQESQVTST